MSFEGILQDYEKHLLLSELNKHKSLYFHLN